MQSAAASRVRRAPPRPFADQDAQPRTPGTKFFRRTDLDLLPKLAVQTHMFLLSQEIDALDDTIISDLANADQVDQAKYNALKELKKARKAMRRCSRCQKQAMGRYIPHGELPTLEESERRMVATIAR